LIDPRALKVGRGSFSQIGGVGPPHMRGIFQKVRRPPVLRKPMRV
jgi:hypothetical protein